MLKMMEEKCLLIHMRQVASSVIIALYIAILLSMLEEECILISMEEEVELSLVTVEYSKILHTSDRTVSSFTSCYFDIKYLLLSECSISFQ